MLVTDLYSLTKAAASKVVAGFDLINFDVLAITGSWSGNVGVVWSGPGTFWSPMPVVRVTQHTIGPNFIGQDKFICWILVPFDPTSVRIGARGGPEE